MTIQEAADLLGLSPATLRVQLRNGKLRGTKRGRDWWITPAAVDLYRRNSLRERTIAPTRQSLYRRGGPVPCVFPGCGLVFTPGYYSEHADTYHQDDYMRLRADMGQAPTF